MSSKVEICNNALALLGDDINIVSLSDASKAGKYCNLLWQSSLDHVLRSYAWRFSIKRWSLPKTTEKPTYGEGNVFVYPPDMLRLLKTEDPNTIYSVEGDRIISDVDTFNCIGVRRVSDTAKFDPSFTNALTLYLASRLCQPITGDTSLQKLLLEEYNVIIEQAKTSSSFESAGRRYTVHGFLDSRLV